MNQEDYIPVEWAMQHDVGNTDIVRHSSTHRKRKGASRSKSTSDGNIFIIQRRMPQMSDSLTQSPVLHERTPMEHHSPILLPSSMQGRIPKSFDLPTLRSLAMHERIPSKSDSPKFRSSTKHERMPNIKSNSPKFRSLVRHERLRSAPEQTQARSSTLGRVTRRSYNLDMGHNPNRGHVTFGITPRNATSPVRRYNGLARRDDTDTLSDSDTSGEDDNLFSYHTGTQSLSRVHGSVYRVSERRPKTTHSPSSRQKKIQNTPSFHRHSLHRNRDITQRDKAKRHKSHDENVEIQQIHFYDNFGRGNLPLHYVSEPIHVLDKVNVVRDNSGYGDHIYGNDSVLVVNDDIPISTIHSPVSIYPGHLHTDLTRLKPTGRSELNPLYVPGSSTVQGNTLSRDITSRHYSVHDDTLTIPNPNVDNVEIREITFSVGEMNPETTISNTTNYEHNQISDQLNILQNNDGSHEERVTTEILSALPVTVKKDHLQDEPKYEAQENVLNCFTSLTDMRQNSFGRKSAIGVRIQKTENMGLPKEEGNDSKHVSPNHEEETQDQTISFDTDCSEPYSAVQNAPQPETVDLVLPPIEKPGTEHQSTADRPSTHQCATESQVNVPKPSQNAEATNYSELQTDENKGGNKPHLPEKKSNEGFDMSDLKSNAITKSVPVVVVNDSSSDTSSVIQNNLNQFSPGSGSEKRKNSDISVPNIEPVSQEETKSYVPSPSLLDTRTENATHSKLVREASFTLPTKQLPVTSYPHYDADRRKSWYERRPIALPKTSRCRKLDRKCIAIIVLSCIVTIMVVFAVIYWTVPR